MSGAWVRAVRLYPFLQFLARTAMTDVPIVGLHSLFASMQRHDNDDDILLSMQSKP